MRLKGDRQSRNVEDRRRVSGRAAGGIGGVALLAILAIGYFTGIDVTPLLEGASQQSSTPRTLTPEEERAGQCVSGVLATTETVWAAQFREELGRDYRPPVLVLFSGVTQSPCGGASGATGPFYCPADGKAYLDTEFFATLASQLGAKGDFAAAYVIAHEIAHHVQNELGILGKANQLRAQGTEAESNAISVRIELQADCLSGVWASKVDHLLDPGDLEEALNAAKMIGDDTLQRRAGQVPQPHTFSHGTSAQRAKWFATGYDAGQMAACDTFSARRL